MITPSMIPQMMGGMNPLANLGVSPPLNVPLDVYEGKFSRSYQTQLGEMTPAFDSLVEQIESADECKQYLEIFAEAKAVQKQFADSCCLQCWCPCKLNSKINELETKREGIQNKLKEKTEAIIYENSNTLKEYKKSVQVVLNTFLPISKSKPAFTNEYFKLMIMPQIDGALNNMMPNMMPNLMNLMPNM